MAGFGIAFFPNALGHCLGTLYEHTAVGTATDSAEKGGRGSISYAECIYFFIARSRRLYRGKLFFSRGSFTDRL